MVYHLLATPFYKKIEKEIILPLYFYVFHEKFNKITKDIIILSKICYNQTNGKALYENIKNLLIGDSAGFDFLSFFAEWFGDPSKE